MDEVEFTIKGERHRMSREKVIRAMRGKEPGLIQTYAVDIEHRRFPVKQVLAETEGIASTDFVSTRARSILGKLGFRVWDATSSTGTRAPDAPRREALERALALAITYLGTSSEPDAARVLRVATQFDRWLDGVAEPGSGHHDAAIEHGLT